MDGLYEKETSSYGKLNIDVLKKEFKENISFIDKSFADKFSYTLLESSNDTFIDVDEIYKWLDFKNKNILENKIISKSSQFMENVDFIKVFEDGKEKIKISIETIKLLSFSSKSKKGKLVRKYLNSMKDYYNKYLSNLCHCSIKDKTYKYKIQKLNYKKINLKLQKNKIKYEIKKLKKEIDDLQEKKSVLSECDDDCPYCSEHPFDYSSDSYSEIEYEEENDTLARNSTHNTFHLPTYENTNINQHDTDTNIDEKIEKEDLDSNYEDEGEDEEEDEEYKDEGEDEDGDEDEEEDKDEDEEYGSNISLNNNCHNGVITDFIRDIILNNNFFRGSLRDNIASLDIRIENRNTLNSIDLDN